MGEFWKKKKKRRVRRESRMTIKMAKRYIEFLIFNSKFEMKFKCFNYLIFKHSLKIENFKFQIKEISCL